MFSSSVCHMWRWFLCAHCGLSSHDHRCFASQFSALLCGSQLSLHDLHRSTVAPPEFSLFRAAGPPPAPEPPAQPQRRGGERLAATAPLITTLTTMILQLKITFSLQHCLSAVQPFQVRATDYGNFDIGHKPLFSETPTQTNWPLTQFFSVS